MECKKRYEDDDDDDGSDESLIQNGVVTRANVYSTTFPFFY